MIRSLSKTAILVFCLGFLIGCSNPIKKIQPDIDAYLTEPSFFNIDTPHGAIRIATSGSPRNPPIIFVHGTPGSWEGWAHFLRNEKLKSHYHLLAIDRIGFGGSQPGHVETSLQKQAEAAITALQLNSSHQGAILVGHSLGGAVIARMAVDHPFKVKGLIFIASSVDPELEKFHWYQSMARWQIFSWLLPDVWRVCNEELYPFKNELEKLLPLWPTLAAPSILIQGEKDTLVPPENIEFLLKHIRPQFIVKSYRWPTENHFILWDKPELILKAFDDFEAQKGSQK